MKFLTNTAAPTMSVVLLPTVELALATVWVEFSVV